MNARPTTDPIADARACADAGRLHEASGILAGVLAAEPHHAAARTLAGYVAFLRGDHEAAERELAQAVEAEPLLLDAHYVRGFAFAARGRVDEACAALRRVLALDPGCVPARVRIAELLLDAGRRDEAAALLQQGLAHGLSPEDVTTVLDTAPAGDDAPANGATGVVRVDERVEWVDPHTLLHPGRLDVIAKFLHARALLGAPASHSRVEAEDVYLRHILFRTGGAEPGDEARKGDLGAFARQFAELVASMGTRGFDPAHPIPVARRTGLVLNGAHRLAAALALGENRVPVTWNDSLEGLRWDEREFVDHAFKPLELDELLRTWLDLRGERGGTVILWPAVEEHWDAIEAEVEAVAPVAGRRDVELPRHAFDELVRDLYVTDWGPVVGENIERKIDRFGAHAPKLRLLAVAADPETLAALKRDVRARWSHVVPEDHFATLHTTASVHETRHVAGILLHGETLAALRARPEEGLRPEFQRWLVEYTKAMKRLRLDPEDCCVVGSSVLEALNVRESTDLDFTVTHRVREKRFTPGVTHVTGELDVVARDYPRVIARPAAPTDDDLIRDRALHFRVRGLKFASLDVVVTRKLMQRRPKDLADVARVGRLRLAGHLAEHGRSGVLPG